MGNRSSEYSERAKEKGSEYTERAKAAASDMSARIQESAAEAVGSAKSVFGVGSRLECGHTPQHKQYFLPPKAPQLNSTDYSFLCEHTDKSKDEIDRIFEKYRLDKIDVKLSKQEFINIYQELHPESKDHVEDVAEHVFLAFDADCTGYISFNEFMVAYALTSRADMNKKIEYAFDLYDFNRFGYLEADELRSVITGMLDVLGADKRHENPPMLVEQTIAKIPTTESGRITKADFIAGLMSNQDIRQLMSPFSTSK